MPLKPPGRRVSDAENKLRLLCCVEALGTVTETQLWPFVAALALMDYMPMQLYLHELLSGGDLETGAHALKEQLFVSAQGRDTLRLFRHRVLPSDQEQIAGAAPAYRAKLLERSQVKAVYEMASPGDYRALLELRDGELPTLTIRIATQSRDLASRAIHAFPTKAAQLLTYLYGLIPSADASIPGGLLERKPSLTFHSAHEYTVTAVLSHPRADITLGLLLPDEQSALAYQTALSSPSVMETAAQWVLEMLCAAKAGK